MKDIINKNERGEYHGYIERVTNVFATWFRCNAKNNRADGYYEQHKAGTDKVIVLKFFIQ